MALLIAPAREQPDPRGVAAAFLSALRTLAHDRQVLVAIDDLQWLDSSSLQVIGFAARRLGPEPVGFLFTRRLDERGSPAPELERVLTSEHLTRIALGPLDADGASPPDRGGSRERRAAAAPAADPRGFRRKPVLRARAGSRPACRRIAPRHGRRAPGAAYPAVAGAGPARSSLRRRAGGSAGCRRPGLTDPRAAGLARRGARQRLAPAHRRARVGHRRGRRRPGPLHAPAAGIGPVRGHAATREAGPPPAAGGARRGSGGIGASSRARGRRPEHGGRSAARGRRPGRRRAGCAEQRR